jgi:trimeric autotransporter adhesin
VKTSPSFHFTRALVWAACPLAAALWPALPFAQTPSGCVVGGVVTSGRIALPGVVVSLVDAQGLSRETSSTGVDGAYTLRSPGAEQYTLKAELVAFAPVVRDLAIDAANCQQRVDLTMTLASRAPAAPPAAPSPAGAALTSTTPTPSAAPVQAVSAPAGGRGGRGGGAGRAGAAGRGGAAGGQQFQSLELLADQAGLARADDSGAGEPAAQILLPPGFSPETSAESVTAIGTSQQNDTFFGPNGPGDFAQRFGDAFGGSGLDGAAGQGRAGGQLGPGGPGGGRGGFGGGPFGPGGLGGLGRGGRGNQIRGTFFQSFDTSGLDAGPFSLNGQATTKPNYLQQRFGATLGGPLVIPKVVNSPRTFFFLNYTGNHSRNPFDAYATVPTAAERGGDLSVLGQTLVDPLTGQPFPNSQIPQARINPSSAALLGLIPLPNQSGDRQNLHTVTTTTSQLDDVNLRIVRTFGATPPRGRGGFGGRGGGGRGGPGGGRAGVSNLNITVHFRHSDNTNANVFPTLGGSSTLTAWDVPVGYSFTKQGLFHSLRFDFNRQHTETTNLYANSQNVAGAAGLLGVSTDPFDWGAPNLSFTKFASLRDISPSARTDRTLSAGDTILKTIGKHTVRFGGDYRDIRADSRADANARGSYVFTGLYSGSDFADFLLGVPQQATVQYGPGLEQFRSRSSDLFVQDDWRATDKVTVNAGLRYEYFSPLSEAQSRLETLDVAPGFTAAVPVAAGGTGPYSGAFTDSIVKPFRAGFAPRVGLAWRPKQGTVVRTGYGINYNASVYQSIAQQLASQPPFAVTNTALGGVGAPLAFATALQDVAPGTTANTYSVDPNYRLGYVQVWNLDLQRDLTRTVQLGVGYTGTKGANLDLLRAPNRGPSGLLIAGVAPFIYESSGADSIMNALTLRLRKRMTNGVAVGGTYMLSKSIDDASSIAGTGGTVAQNDQNLAAERGLSSFDQRHRLSGDFTYELPFGSNKRWFNGGVPAQIFGNWVLNGNAQLASGTPLTVRVLGAASDVAQGLNGTLRANYNGQPINLANPTTAEFFNIAAFSVPAPGTFGNSGRNIVIGPGTSVMNLGLTRNITFGQTRALSVQLLASNVFNTVQFASVDTAINSPTFGLVTSVRPMRRVQVLTRFRF